MNDNDIDQLTQARTLLETGQLEKCLLVLKKYWLQHPDDPEAVLLFSELMSKTGLPNLSSKLHSLSDTMRVDPSTTNSTTHQEMFEAGYGLIDVRQHELAAMLLTLLTILTPGEAIVNYELGFSLMSLGRFSEAITYFDQAKTIVDDFDTSLNLAICYTLTRRIDLAKENIANMVQFVSTKEEAQELQHRRLVITRLEGLGNKSVLSARDWLYVLYGSILLRPPEKLQQINEDYSSLATMLTVLKGVLEGLRAEIEAVEFYNLDAKPMARILAELIEIPLDSYRGPDRPDRALLVLARATDIIGPHQAFAANTLNRVVFSYGLSWTEPLPIVPDIVGHMTQDTNLPFPEYGKEEATIAKVLERARNLESNPEIIKAVQDAVEYYSDKKEFLVFLNPEHLPQRPEYTAEIQKPSAEDN